MSVIYVVGDQPGAGSTSVASAMALIRKKAGQKVGLIKPASLTSDQFDQAFFDVISDYSDQEPTVQVQQNAIGPTLIEAICSRTKALTALTDTLIIEGLPLADYDGKPIGDSDILAKRLDANVVLVTSAASGHEPPSGKSWTEYYGPNFLGAIINRLPQYARCGQSSETPDRVLGYIREQRCMLAPTVRQVVDHLGGTLFSSSDIQEQKLIEHFLIGGLILEWGGNYFGRLPNQAVIVRGGRTDIQMSALNFPLSCMILTDCDTPAQYVHQRAESQDVPLLVVPMTTMETMEALETIQDRASSAHLEKAEQFAMVLTSCVDWSSVDGP